MPKPIVLPAPSSANSPNYVELVEFLIKPFLESPTGLSVDCEHAKQKRRVWIRVALEGTDKGRFFGRGGRNLQAIRTVLEMAAATVGQTLYLDIYDSDRANGEGYAPRKRSPYGDDKESGKFSRRRPRSRASISSNY